MKHFKENLLSTVSSRDEIKIEHQVIVRNKTELRVETKLAQQYNLLVSVTRFTSYPGTSLILITDSGDHIKFRQKIFDNFRITMK